MDRRARFEYGTASAWEAPISSPPWDPVDDSVGGARVGASGVGAAYVVRRDALVEVTVRYYEADWASLLALLVFGQTQQAFRWFPDADEATSFLVYLDAPRPGTKTKPDRDANYPRAFKQTLVLRGAGTTPWTPYFTG